MQPTGRTEESGQGQEAMFDAPDAPAAGALVDAPEIPLPAPLDHHGPAKVVAMVNQKGGVGDDRGDRDRAAAGGRAGREE